uniref:Uncharacterized protein n=1 Tax=Chromera velia CCMP2878 TaxID=1169474 RepID=A0A0G4I6U1_9ALVE|eukprot:Cvel_11429.t1-p1 / transcript=Cvel_11429.t1 / gene=Cvel_11429 / organism=Chromera_velia_CCMP2878 / gene_product=hypothetical protein / transcript_product=hypothetical protein / location=Cvel_scaffold718:47374-47571(-) / protein_length=66 / sequence_SO=supercontig / SO=protein_coding / is_pseudo=false
MTLRTQSDPIYYAAHEDLDIYLEFEDLYDNEFDLPDLVASDDEENEGMGVDGECLNSMTGLASLKV